MGDPMVNGGSHVNPSGAVHLARMHLRKWSRSTGFFCGPIGDNALNQTFYALAKGKLVSCDPTTAKRLRNLSRYFRN